MTKYRIGHPDPLNWTIEEFQEGGGIVSRGRYAGQEKKSCWLAPELFYPTLKDAAKALLDKAPGDAILSGECSSILEAITLGESRVMETLSNMEKKE